MSGGIHIGAELSEGGDLTELSQVELHCAGNLLHRLHLGGGADARDGKTDVDGGADTLFEIIIFTSNFEIDINKTIVYLPSRKAHSPRRSVHR